MRAYERRISPSLMLAFLALDYDGSALLPDAGEYACPQKTDFSRIEDKALVETHVIMPSLNTFWPCLLFAFLNSRLGFAYMLLGGSAA